MIRSFLLSMAILFTVGCSQQKPFRTVTGEQQTATVVQVETVAASQIPDLYRASGTLRARQVADISAKIAANILEVRVHVGDHVHAGQILMILDRRDLEANLRRAEAARTEAENAVSETENAITAARASVDLARVTHKRFQDLLAKASVSQQEFDESQARLRNAEASFEMAVSKQRQVQARRSQYEEEVAAARVALGYATLISPFNGLITERKSDPGSLAIAGAPLLTVEREGNLRLEVSLDESRLGLARIGDEVMVDIDGLNRPLSGNVGEVVPSVDPATRTVTAKIDLPAAPDLRSGMFGRAVFVAGKREALLVPQSAISERGQIRTLHVVEGDTARLRLVTLGESRGDSREITSGLSAGETIIVAPPALLADGGRVAVQKASR